MTGSAATSHAIGMFLITATILTAATATNAQIATGHDAAPVAVVDVVRARRLAGPIELDGVLDDAAWQCPGETRHVQNDPDNGREPRQSTEFWIAYDDAALYVAARLHDSAPDSISARLGRRDTWPSSDWLYINLDTFNDDRNAYSFSINPAGVLGDAKLYNDGASDTSWDGVWQAATRIDELGWVAEVRIPFSQLKFPATSDQVWGLNLSRRTLRFHERTDLFHKPRGSSGYGRRFPDLVGIHGIEPELQTEITPYLLGKGEYRDVEAGDPFASDPDHSRNAGVDLKTALSNNLTLSASVNPDFGQVEVDPAVVNLGAYETFYQERRPFFVEDANVFRFGREGLNSNWNFNWEDPMLFYSRRVGRAPQLGIEGDYDFLDRPQVTTILGAAKVSGKIGNTSVGAMTAVTAREKAHLEFDGERTDQVVEPLTTYNVARASYTRPDGSGGLGVMMTGTVRDLDDPVSQVGLDKRSFAAGIDGFTNLDDEGVWALKAYLSGSHIAGSREAVDDLQRSHCRYFQRPDADHLDYDPDATELRGWIGRVGVNKQSGNWRFNSALGYSSPGYDVNDAGFQYRTDTVNSSMVGGYSWREPHGIFRNQSVYAGSYKTWDTGGMPAHYGGGVWYWSQLANYWSVDGNVFCNPEHNDPQSTRGGPIMREPTSRQWRANVSTDSRKGWVMSVGGGGSRDDGGSRSAYGNLSLRLQPRPSLGLEIAPRYSWSQDEAHYYDDIEDPAMTDTYGHRYLFADLEYRQFSLETRLDWTFTPNLTLQAYVQPLFAVGRYTDHKELARPGSYAFNRFGQDNGSSIVYDPAGDPDNPYLVTPEGSSPDDTFRLGDRDFNFKSLKVNMVLRWEYAAGSTVYVVWTQNRADQQNPGHFDLGRDMRSLLDASGEHILMLKVSQYFSL